ncbi:MAG: DUF2851 family protein [Dehalococcoidales bacterium]|nr:DUF2851 family protein [Dehalococcoidales bacterium]
MKSNLAEYRLVDLWRDLVSREDTLVTENGEPLRIIYPGRLNDDRGADFRDAVIIRGNVIQQGEIELHVNSGDWEAHGHHRNPAYNNVILHVVLEENGSLTMHRANGELLPTLSLRGYLEKRLQAAPSALPCAEIAVGNPEKVTHLLDEAGEARFRQKVAEFQSELMQTAAGQVLYWGILGALGYSKNKTPCQKLADIVPLRVLASLTQNLSEKESLLRQQALLLGAAGLLPSLRSVNSNNDKYIVTLEKLWLEHSFTETLASGNWNLFKVRPNNSPLRRLAALSHLVWRYRHNGLSGSLLDLIGDTRVENVRELTDAFLVNSSGYWAAHYDFGLACSRFSPALIGADRAGEIIINILLPFIYARENSSGKSLDMFCHYPVLPANSIEKHLQKQLGLGKGMINSACRQQGLIHIYKTFCIQGKCMECALV